MAQRKVTAIPATITKYTAVPIGSKRKRRVAGYARVSTDHEDQVTSYEAQVDYYTNYIKGRDDWEFVAIYTDEGISATNTKRREGFKAMVADALAGKIDLIVTKSVSRFARNTVDSLTTVRMLKEKGVEELFSAARRCKEEGLDCRFDFIGGLEENYKDKIDELQQEGILRYHGFQNDIKPFVADCDCVVLPSYHEGMSNALLESAAMGRALIASDIPGCREAVVAGENGFLCARKDAEDLYRRLSEFIALDPARKAEMGKSSRKLMEDRFDKRRVVAKTIEEMMP